MREAGEADAALAEAQQTRSKRQIRSTYKQDVYQQDQGSRGDDYDDYESPTKLGKRKHATRGAARSPSDHEHNGTTSGRYDSSLGMLTKKFIQLVEGSTDGTLDLNHAAENLKVQKRRIYDITNVLEGVGLIEKKSKNNIQWKPQSAADMSTEEAEELAGIKAELAMLEKEELVLDKHIRLLTDAVKAMSEHPYNKSRLYVTDSDISSLPCFAGDTIFAVKAPLGTTLEVPDPEEDAAADGRRRYRILLRSTSGAITVFLIQHPQQAADGGNGGGTDGGGGGGNVPQPARQQQLPGGPPAGPSKGPGGHATSAGRSAAGADRAGSSSSTGHSSGGGRPAALHLGEAAGTLPSMAPPQPPPGPAAAAAMKPPLRKPAAKSPPALHVPDPASMVPHIMKTGSDVAMREALAGFCPTPIFNASLANLISPFPGSATAGGAASSYSHAGYSPSLNKLLEIDPDAWFNDPLIDTNTMSIQDFFKDEQHSIFTADNTDDMRAAVF